MPAARYRWSVIVALWLSVPAGTSWGQPPQGAKKPPPRFPPTVVVERDVEYGRAGDVSLKLDIVRPKQPSEKPLPVIAEIHGGGWSRGSKESDGRTELFPTRPPAITSACRSNIASRAWPNGPPRSTTARRPSAG